MLPINCDVISLYGKVSSQVIPSMSGPIAINEIAVLNRINLDKSIKEEDKEEMLDLVSFVAGNVIAIRNKHERQKRENK